MFCNDAAYRLNLLNAVSQPSSKTSLSNLSAYRIYCSALLENPFGEIKFAVNDDEEEASMLTVDAALPSTLNTVGGPLASFL